MARRRPRKKTKWENYWENQPKKKVQSLASIPMVQDNLLVECIEIPLLTGKGCNIAYLPLETQTPQNSR